VLSQRTEVKDIYVKTLNQCINFGNIYYYTYYLILRILSTDRYFWTCVYNTCTVEQQKMILFTLHCFVAAQIVDWPFEYAHVRVGSAA
jgi:hypothetical protein